MGVGSEGWEGLVPWYTGLEVSGRGGHLLCGHGGGPSSLSPPPKASGEHGGHSWSDSLYPGTAMVQGAPGRGAGEATKEEVAGSHHAVLPPSSPSTRNYKTVGR